MICWHKWITVKDTGKYQYQECSKCNKRRVEMMYVEGYQPIDENFCKN